MNRFYGMPMTTTQDISAGYSVSTIDKLQSNPSQPLLIIEEMVQEQVMEWLYVLKADMKEQNRKNYKQIHAYMVTYYPSHLGPPGLGVFPPPPPTAPSC